MILDEALDKKIQDMLSREYIPFQECLDFESMMFQVPYEVEFSLQPYVRKIMGTMNHACEMTKSNFLPLIEEYQRQVSLYSSDIESFKTSMEFKSLSTILFPTMFIGEEYACMCPPFSNNIIVSSPNMELLKDSDQWEFRMDPSMIHARNFMGEIMYAIILNKVHGFNIPINNTQVMVLRNKKTKIHKHFQVVPNNEFIDVEIIGEIPVLSEKERKEVINHLDDASYLQRLIPVGSIKIKGFMLANFIDITSLEVLSEAKEFLNGDVLREPEKIFESIADYVRSISGVPCVQAGGIAFDKKNLFSSKNVSIAEISSDDFKMQYPEPEIDITGVYGEVFRRKATIFREELNQVPDPDKLEKLLIEKGVKGIILHPTLDKNNKVVSILELVSFHEKGLNRFSIDRLEDFLNLIDEGYDKIVDDIQNRISRVVKDNFTSIHPSVEWKFEEVALEFLNNQSDQVTELKSIVFEKLHPLYGQSDIVGSSAKRNESIQADLLDNLSHLIDIMSEWSELKELYLVDTYLEKIKLKRSEIEDRIISSDETEVVRLILDEVNPLLKSVYERHKDLPRNKYRSYLEALDADLGIIYKSRKSYEHSVSILNNHVSRYIQEADNKMQAQLPHYFEKYKTDGVEYNLYVGDSLLEGGGFKDFDLKNFKIWQMVNMCGVVKEVHNLSPKLPVPLTTASLIFVYNQPIAIRFRMDEKKFDVDGTYNVRYEILKKRIDKSKIIGTGERLTVSGKIAIVYLNESDKAEYLEIIDYLQKKGLIEDEVEDLSLEKMQGAEGLKALRVTVQV